MARTRSMAPLARLLGAGLIAAALVAGPTSGGAFLAGSRIAEAASVSDCTTHILRRGSSDQPCVTAFQQALNRAAWLGEDGNFGPATYYAVLSFQASKGLAVDGVAGPRTLAALTARLRDMGVQPAPPQLAANLPDCQTMRRGSSDQPCVTAFQQALNRAAWLGEDGNFGPAMYYAVLSFQASKGLAVDGVAGPRTLAALAGQAAPAPQPVQAPPPPSLGPTYTHRCSRLTCHVYISRHVTVELAEMLGAGGATLGQTAATCAETLGLANEEVCFALEAVGLTSDALSLAVDVAVQKGACLELSYTSIHKLPVVWPGLPPIPGLTPTLGTNNGSNCRD